MRLTIVLMCLMTVHVFDALDVFDAFEDRVDVFDDRT